jgi:nucleoside-diphosphate-sugar epimerase
VATSFIALIDAARGRGLDALPPAAWATIDTANLAGRTLFVTGATGFAGRWLLAAVARHNATMPTPLRVRALTRAEGPFEAPWLTWVRGDIRDFTDNAHADLVLHAALPSTATPAGGDAALRETAVRGAEAVAGHARAVGAARSVILSSGSVYGTAYGPVNESSPLAELGVDDAYGAAKREVEAIATASIASGHDVVVARLFTCIGVGYRAHGHLGHVSMLDDARAGRPIIIRSDGSAVRSYLFGADLAVWLLSLLARSGNDTVNIGSDAAISLVDFAHAVARSAGRGADTVIVRATDPIVRPYFVPDITRARAAYGLEPWTGLEASIVLTLAAGGN